MSNKNKKVALVEPVGMVRPIPTIGFGYLAAMVEREGHSVRIFNARMDGDETIKSQITRIEHWEPDVLCVTLLTSPAILRNAYQMIAAAKDKNIPVVCGGAHATAEPDEVLSHGADIVVRGEGDFTLGEVLTHLPHTDSLEDIKGISFLKDGHVFHSEDRPTLMDLDSLPFPAYHHFRLSSHKPFSGFFPIRFSRGCPFKCVYCANYNMSKRYRNRSAESAFEELLLLYHQFGIRVFNIIDDFFLGNRKFVEQFLDLLLQRPEIKIKFHLATRVTSVDEEILKKLKRAGCLMIAYGVESLVPEILEKLDKSITVDQVFKVAELTEKAGIFFKYNLIFGFPWETEESVGATIDTINKICSRSRYGFPNPFRLVPYPKTAIYEEFAEKEGFTRWWLKDEYFNKPFRDYYFRLPERVKELNEFSVFYSLVLAYSKKEDLLLRKGPFRYKNFFLMSGFFFLSRIVPAGLRLRCARVLFRLYSLFKKPQAIAQGVADTDGE
jgi:radical SAM superfamily enzyme YgiQ (UPF0313 family)